MKKVSLFGLVLAATTAYLTHASANVEGAVAVAQPGPGCPKAFQGFGLKGNIGYGVGWGKTRFSNSDLGSSGRATSGFRGVDGGIGVDYTHRICSWALALGFDANWAGTKGSHSFTSDDLSSSSKTRLRNALQLYGKVGYVIREIAMPFIALGWDNSQWKHSGSTTFTATDPNTGLVETFTDSAKKSKRLNSFLWKIGVDFLATRHVVFGLEYTGTIANKVKFTGRNEIISGSVKPQYNTFKATIKIVYP